MILRNAIRCKKCNTVLESKHRHDYVSCECGCAADGGKAYLRRAFPDGHPDDWFEELSEVSEDRWDVV